ncbi:hypothetical protein I7I50_03696 [Histoplasma capsulatum G186AR]|uniref:Uncharacterized protein n=1 Tax=Ajellomyces capsulatus TaxID=5037 RepID=A0A8H7YPC4_AJECA|nr:hypothetical protein I7I52_04603 [Histoplasma capsulatum]QSS74776.1 hypothetical protein I7I50_03696 [Histoplasma capsulatum G186AR]
MLSFNVPRTGNSSRRCKQNRYIYIYIYMGKRTIKANKRIRDASCQYFSEQVKAWRRIFSPAPRSGPIKRATLPTR